MSKSSKKTKDIDAVDKHGWTALHHAAREGNMNEVKRLLAAGANVDARTTALAHDSTPLVIATRSKHFDIMRLLLDRGADIEARDNEGYGGQKKHLDKKNTLYVPIMSHRFRPLFHAVEDGPLKSVDYLIWKGANVNSVNNYR